MSAEQTVPAAVIIARLKTMNAPQVLRVVKTLARQHPALVHQAVETCEALTAAPDRARPEPRRAR